MSRFLLAALLCPIALAAWAPDPNACLKAIEEMAVTSQDEFAKLLFSCGKSLPYDAGKYVMCMNAKDTRYFLVKMNAGLPSTPGKPIPMEVGLCVPNVCDHAGVVGLVKSKLSHKIIPELSLLTLTNITTTSPQLDLKDEGVGGIVAAAFVGLLFLLVLVSSAIVLSQKPRPSELPQHLQLPRQQLLDSPEQQHQTQPLPAKLPQVVEAFSLFGKSGTLVKLMEIPAYKPTDSLNGLRVLSMAWIILGHTFLMPMGISGYGNQEDIVQNSLNTDTAEQSPWFAIILSAQSGVDTFFFLSGFLLSYLTLKELREGRMKIAGAVILRYLRLTPSLALVMLVFFKIWVFFGYGPFAVRFQDSINRRCAGSWWSELTYTMNFVPFDSDKICMGWSWYLGDDMIFFIISILILPIYHRRRWMGWLILLGLTGMSLGVTTWLVLKHNLSIYVFDDNYKRYSYWAYSKPYTRIPAYFVGVGAAWVLAEMEERGITRETRPLTAFARICATLGAAIAFAVLLFLTFIPSTDFGDQKDSWRSLASVLFIDLSRPVWAMCWAAITLLCYYDFLPLVNSFLAHPYWAPLARLTYGAYLVHPLLIKLAAGRSLQYYTFNSWDMAYRFTGNLIMAYSGSVLLWILVERPCMTMFSPARKPQRKSNASNDCRTDSAVSEVSTSCSRTPSRDVSSTCSSNDVMSGANISNSDIISAANWAASHPFVSCKPLTNADLASLDKYARESP